MAAACIQATSLLAIVSSLILRRHCTAGKAGEGQDVLKLQCLENVVLARELQWMFSDASCDRFPCFAESQSWWPLTWCIWIEHTVERSSIVDLIWTCKS